MPENSERTCGHSGPDRLYPLDTVPGPSVGSWAVSTVAAVVVAGRPWRSGKRQVAVTVAIELRSLHIYNLQYSIGSDKLKRVYGSVISARPGRYER